MSFQTITREHIEAADKIITSYQCGFRWSILIAQMQSGKTFTFLLVCSELIRVGLIESVIIFSGNTEIDLKEQLVKKVTGEDEEFFESYQDYLEDIIQLNRESRRKIIRQIKEKITVIWGTELNKFKLKPEKTLFIWEEAHFAQNLNQCPDKFLTRVGISGNGDHECLEEKGNFVLTVSATPFSELSDNFHDHQDKKVVYLRPGTGYNSVKMIRDSGRLKGFTSVDDALPEALNKYHESPKYALVRMSKTNEDKLIAIIQANHWDFVIYDTLGKDEIGKKDKSIIEKGERVWKNMKNAPEKDTVILLRGKCRMGKNLEKQHVLFVMETAKSSNTDTVLQSLLGRVCGYSTGSDKIDVYLHQKIVKSGEIDRYIKLVEGMDQSEEVRLIPRKARNLTGKRVETHSPIIPIRITRTNSSNDRKDILFDVYNAFIYDTARIINKNSEEKLQEVSGTFVDAWNRGKKDLKVCYLKKKEGGTRTEKIANEIKEAYQNSIAKKFGSGCGIDSEGLEVNIWVSKKELQDPELTQYIYITAHVEKSENLHEDRIPKTTLNEVFAHTLEDGRIVHSNGSFKIELPIESSVNVSIMREYIMDFVFISRTHTKSRSVTSQWDDKDKEYKGILVDKEVETSLLPGGEIYNLVFEEGFELKLTPSTKKTKAGYKKYASISW